MGLRRNFLTIWPVNSPLANVLSITESGSFAFSCSSCGYVRLPMRGAISGDGHGGGVATASLSVEAIHFEMQVGLRVARNRARWHVVAWFAGIPALLSHD